MAANVYRSQEQMQSSSRADAYPNLDERRKRAFEATSDHQDYLVSADRDTSCWPTIEDLNSDSTSTAFVTSYGDFLAVAVVGRTGRKYQRCRRFCFSIRLRVEILLVEVHWNGYDLKVFFGRRFLSPAKFSVCGL